MLSYNQLSADVDMKIYRICSRAIFAQPVLSVIAEIVCIDETYANSLLAVYGYDKSYQVKT